MCDVRARVYVYASTRVHMCVRVCVYACVCVCVLWMEGVAGVLHPQRPWAWGPARVYRQGRLPQPWRPAVSAYLCSYFCVLASFQAQTQPGSLQGMELTITAGETVMELFLLLEIGAKYRVRALVPLARKGDNSFHSSSSQALGRALSAPAHISS